MLPLPTRYFVATGAAASRAYPEAAADAARAAAGLGDVNLLPFDGVLPIGIEEVKPRQVEPGGFRAALVGSALLAPGERGCAGVAVAWREDRQGGYAVAGGGAVSSAALRKALVARLAAMGEVRGVALGKPKVALVAADAPEGAHGAAVAALVLLP